MISDHLKKVASSQIHAADDLFWTSVPQNTLNHGFTTPTESTDTHFTSLSGSAASLSGPRSDLQYFVFLITFTIPLVLFRQLLAFLHDPCQVIAQSYDPE